MALTKIKTSGIADNAITNAKMADDAIDSADFADASIDLAHMSANSVDSDQYVDGSIDNVHLAGSIAVSKTLLAGGTGLTLSTNTLAVDAAQTQITSVGTLTSFRSTGIDDNADALAMTIDSSERVGIGTASPNANAILHVSQGSSSQTTSSNNTQLTIENSGTTGIQLLAGTGNVAGIWVGDSEGAEDGKIYYSNSTGDWSIVNRGNVSMTVDDTGNVGIGKSPTVKFETIGSAGANSIVRFLAPSGSYNSAIELWGDAGEDANDGMKIMAGHGAQGLYFYSSKDSGIGGSTAWDMRMHIGANGNVGIGTDTIANESDHRKLVISGASGTGAGMIEFADTSNNIDGAIFADGGNLFIVADRDDATDNSSIKFRVDGSTERMNIDGGGNVTVNTGDLIFGTAGKGICLGVTSNTDANTLDDYEEGTWTPEVVGGDTAGTWTAQSANSGVYTKIGRTVILGFSIYGYLTGASGTYARFNLPWTAVNSGYSTNIYYGYVNNPNASTIWDGGYVGANSNSAYLTYKAASGTGVGYHGPGSFTNTVHFIGTIVMTTTL